MIEFKVVVETGVHGRAVGELGLWEEACDGLGHDVRGGMAREVEGVGFIFGGHEGEGGVFGDGSGDVRELAINDGAEGVFCEPRADGFGDFEGGDGGRVEFFDGAIGEGDFDHDGLVSNRLATDRHRQTRTGEAKKNAARLMDRRSAGDGVSCVLRKVRRAAWWFAWYCKSSAGDGMGGGSRVSRKGRIRFAVNMVRKTEPMAIIRTALSFTLGCVVGLGAIGCERTVPVPSTGGSSTASAPADTAPVDPKIAELESPDTQPVLKMEDFESGKLQMGTVEAPRLMTLLIDLKDRRDKDRSDHDGKRGPDGAYLDDRIQVVTELQRRGYPVDNEGMPVSGR